MRRLTRLQNPSSIASTCASPSRSHAAPVRCARRRDFSCIAQPTRVSPGATLSSRTPTVARSFSAAPALCQKPKKIEWIPVHENEEVDPVEDFEPDGVEFEPADFHTDLRVPGRIKTSPRAEEITDPSYVPAETADGLEWVGGLNNWWEDERNWPASMNFTGFGRAEKVVDRVVLEVLVRRAVVEALAVRKGAGEEALNGHWQAGGRDQLVSALGVGIEVSEDGAAELKGNFMGVVEGLTTIAEDQDAGSGDLTVAPEEAREFIKSWDRSWKQISLDDPRLLFAVTKRIQQLTGHVIPDSKLLHIRTVSSLLGAVVKPPKAKKLAQVIEAKGDLTELPNVKLYSRRVTPIDKEKMVGRWKVIVRELEKRGLPVTGTGGYEKNVESKWASGKA